MGFLDKLKNVDTSSAKNLGKDLINVLDQTIAKPKLVIRDSPDCFADSSSISPDERPFYKSDNYYTYYSFPGSGIGKPVTVFEDIKKTSYPSARGLYVPEILLLEYCCMGKYPKPSSGYPGFWWFEYGIRDIGHALESLFARGFLKWQPVYKGLYPLKVTEIKSILDSHGLPSTGQKMALIARIEENIPEENLFIPDYVPKYELTELGIQELKDNGYVPYMHKHKMKRSEGNGTLGEFTVWSVNKYFQNGDARNWRAVVAGIERQRFGSSMVDSYVEEVSKVNDQPVDTPKKTTKSTKPASKSTKTTEKKHPAKQRDDKDLDTILQEIHSGLTRHPKSDLDFLKKKCEEYKDHEYAQPILRECGRLMYDLLPDDKKDEISKIIGEEKTGYVIEIEDIKACIHKGDFNKALELAETLVKKIEDLNMFIDDPVSEYRLFDEFFEEALYRFLYKPLRTLPAPEIPYTEIYYLYGAILVELKQLDEARKALQKGMHWNPVAFNIRAEYVETFKMQGDMDQFFKETLALFKIAFRSPLVARCLRNLGYYFVEKQQYPEAVAVYVMSTRYENSSPQVQNELNYINQVAGGIKQPTVDDMQRYSTQYGFPMGADKDVLGMAHAYGTSFLKENNFDGARYCFDILYELTGDEEVKKLIDSIPG